MYYRIVLASPGSMYSLQLTYYSKPPYVGLWQVKCSGTWSNECSLCKRELFQHAVCFFPLANILGKGVYSSRLSRQHGSRNNHLRSATYFQNILYFFMLVALTLTHLVSIWDLESNEFFIVLNIFSICNYIRFLVVLLEILCSSAVFDVLLKMTPIVNLLFLWYRSLYLLPLLFITSNFFSLPLFMYTVSTFVILLCLSILNLGLWQ